MVAATVLAKGLLAGAAVATALQDSDAAKMAPAALLCRRLDRRDLFGEVGWAKLSSRWVSGISMSFWKAVITAVPATPDTTPRPITLADGGRFVVSMEPAYLPVRVRDLAGLGSGDARAGGELSGLRP